MTTKRTKTGGRAPVDSKTREEIVRLARSGMSRNAVARQTEVSASTVTRVCSAATPPWTFDRSNTAVATEARQTDLKAMRADLSRGMLETAVKLHAGMLDQIERVHFSVTLGESRYMAPPTPSEVQAAAITVGILIDKHLVIVDHDTDAGELSAVDAWNQHLMGDAPDVPAEWQ